VGAVIKDDQGRLLLIKRGMRPGPGCGHCPAGGSSPARPTELESLPITEGLVEVLISWGVLGEGGIDRPI
jgi:hypothetical protein